MLKMNLKAPIRVRGVDTINNYIESRSAGSLHLELPTAPPPHTLLSILVQVPLWHPAVLRSPFHLPLPFFGPDVFPPLNYNQLFPH